MTAFLVFPDPEEFCLPFFDVAWQVRDQWGIASCPLREIEELFIVSRALESVKILPFSDGGDS